MKKKSLHDVVTYPRMGFLLPLVFLLLGTWHFLFEDDPDHLSLTSAGGHCLLEATQVGDIKATLEERENGTISFLFSPLCALTPEGQGILTQVTLQTVLPEETAFEQGTVFRLWKYEPMWMAWQPQKEAYEEGGFFVISKPLVSQTTFWAVGTWREREITTQARQSLSSLLQAPPQGAVGYRAAVTQANAGEDFVVVNDVFEEGGCGGEMLVTSKTTVTSLEATIEGGTERVVVQWFLKDGCETGQRLHAVAQE